MKNESDQLFLGLFVGAVLSSLFCYLLLADRGEKKRFLEKVKRLFKFIEKKEDELNEIMKSMQENGKLTNLSLLIDFLSREWR